MRNLERLMFAPLLGSVTRLAILMGVPESHAACSTRAVDAEYADTRELQPVIDFLYRYKQIDHPFNARDLISPLALKPGER